MKAVHFKNQKVSFYPRTVCFQKTIETRRTRPGDHNIL